MFPPIFNPYHKLMYASGYAYANEKFEPFVASSAPEVAIYFPNMSNPTGDIDVHRGEIGAGNRKADRAFWFGAYNVSIGCEANNSSECFITVTAYAYDATAERNEVVLGRQYVSVPACDSSSGCKLHPVQFPDTFRGLTGIQFSASVNGDDNQNFVLDSLALGWYDNSCAAGLKRAAIRG
jgi:hypothetical protein